MRFFPKLLSLVTLAAITNTASATTEISFWHSMEGALGERVHEIVENFNKTQSDYKVVATYKGNYGESMNAGIAAFRAGQAPDQGNDADSPKSKFIERFLLILVPEP